jgi:hypothetical protein
METKSVEWMILRHGARIHIWAAKGPEGWGFMDREIGDVRWFPVTAAPELIAEAEHRVSTSASDSASSLRAAA